MQFIGKHLERIIPSLEPIIGITRLKIKQEDFEQEDLRFDRVTQSLPGHFIVLKEDVIFDLLDERPLPKYEDDWNRMKKGFDYCVEEANKDVNSRRLVFFNADDYYNVFECFNLFQFVVTKRGEWDLYIYQRSSDIAKLQDDLVFFANVAKEFGDAIKEPVTKIVIVFGNIHYEKPSDLS